MVTVCLCCVLFVHCFRSVVFTSILNIPEWPSMLPRSKVYLLDGLSRAKTFFALATKLSAILPCIVDRTCPSCTTSPSAVIWDELTLSILLWPPRQG